MSEFVCRNLAAPCTELCWIGTDVCDAEAAYWDKAEQEGDYIRDEKGRA